MHTVEPVVVRCVLSAPRSLVFAELTDSGQLPTWWGPAGFSAPIVEVDLRVGGAYRIAMQPPAGDAFYLAGEFREIDPPVRLVDTFRWEDPDPDDRETLVTLSLVDLGGSTQLTVRHTGFATDARRALHQQGWTEALDRLKGVIGG